MVAFTHRIYIKEHSILIYTHVILMVITLCAQVKLYQWSTYKETYWRWETQRVFDVQPKMDLVVLLSVWVSSWCMLKKLGVEQNIKQNYM